VSETVTASNQLMERKNRLFEDVRLLGVVLTTAFEGRVDRVNERVEDYRRLLERRRAAPPSEPKRGSETPRSRSASRQVSEPGRAPRVALDEGSKSGDSGSPPPRR